LNANLGSNRGIFGRQNIIFFRGNGWGGGHREKFWSSKMPEFSECPTIVHGESILAIKENGLISV